MKILITGGTGFIGSHLAEHFLREGHTTHICDNNFRGSKDKFICDLIEKGVKFINCDLMESEQLKKLDKDYDLVFHFAAINGTENFYSIPYLVMQVNILSTINLLEYYSGVDNKFIYASSSEVYASTFNLRKDMVPTPENIELCIDDIFNPRYSYGGSKMTCELLLTSYAKQYGLNFQIIRFSNVYGPRMGFKHVIPQLTKRAFDSQDPYCVYGPEQTRAFCFVKDAIRATAELSLKDESGIFHIGNDEEELPIIKLAQKVVDHFNYKPHFDIREAPKGSVHRRCPDITKIKNLLNFVPEYCLDDGLQETIDWYSDYYRNNIDLRSEFL